MSIETTVIIEENKLPTPERLQEFISSSMLKLKIDTNFEWDKHTGWLPCKYNELATGFELYTESFTPSALIEEEFVTKEESELLENRSYMITFVTHFKVLDSLSAFLVSSCLAKLADGYVLENAEPPFIEADKIYKDIKKLEQEYLNML